MIVSWNTIPPRSRTVRPAPSEVGVAEVTAANQAGMLPNSTASERCTADGGAATSAVNTRRTGADVAKSSSTGVSRRAMGPYLRRAGLKSAHPS